LASRALASTGGAAISSAKPRSAPPVTPPHPRARPTLHTIFLCALGVPRRPQQRRVVAAAAMASRAPPAFGFWIDPRAS
jgi:hypothetical protein